MTPRTCPLPARIGRTRPQTSPCPGAKPDRAHRTCPRLVAKSDKRPRTWLRSGKEVMAEAEEKRAKDEARQGSGREVMKEAEEKRAKDEARFAQLDPSVSGRGAQTVYRDKAGACGRAVKGEVVADCVCVAGKRVSNLEAIMAEEKAKKSRVLPPPEWGKGLVQKREAERQQADLDAVAARPFAAYENDEERDRMLKNVVRFGDPMAHLVKVRVGSNISADALLEDLSRDPAMQASGFTVPQAIPPHSWLKRRVSAPHNRYGIRPGRHWDGVDRSNGEWVPFLPLTSSSP
ncbi:unnamed protein product [Closterium sp. Naga37s-1]|nr:unnamed protein product [Closterium sp. Naga37s-1]